MRTREYNRWASLSNGLGGSDGQPEGEPMTHDDILAAAGRHLDKLFALATGWASDAEVEAGEVEHDGHVSPIPNYHRNGAAVLARMRALGWEDSHSWTAANGAYWRFSREAGRQGFLQLNTVGDWTDPDDGVAVVKAALTAIRRHREAKP